jgi:hypothetical protein
VYGCCVISSLGLPFGVLILFWSSFFHLVVGHKLFSAARGVCAMASQTEGDELAMNLRGMRVLFIFLRVGNNVKPEPAKHGCDYT